MQGRQGAGRTQGQGTEGRAGLQDSILRFSRPENLKITFLQLFEKKGEGRAGQGLGSERLGAGQHRARAKARLREGQGAGRVQGQGTEGRAGLQDSTQNHRAGQGLGSERLGAGQHRARAKARAKGRANCRAGRAQAGCRGRAQRAGQGCKNSILRFSRPENLKITFLQLFEKKGEGRAGQGLGSERLGAGQHRASAKARAKGRCRAGRAQAGCRGRAQRAGQGCQDFHFEVFKA